MVQDHLEGHMQEHTLDVFVIIGIGPPVSCTYKPRGGQGPWYDRQHPVLVAYVYISIPNYNIYEVLQN